jgi:hypothetical protein
MVGVGVLGGRAPHAEGTVTEIKIKLIMYILAYDLLRKDNKYVYNHKTYLMIILIFTQ